MRHILVIADAGSGTSPALKRAAELQQSEPTRLHVIGFVHEALPHDPQIDTAALREALLVQRRRQLMRSLQRYGIDAEPQVLWEKRIAEWVGTQAGRLRADMVIKTGHRSETWHHTPTDWQLLRSCPAPVLIVPQRAWHSRGAVLAAVDLGTRLPAKRALNVSIVEAAEKLARSAGAELHLAYAVPQSPVLRDLGVSDRRRLVAAARQRAERFIEELRVRGIDGASVHVKAGTPYKVLVSLAAQAKARTLVIGCVGRKALSGRIIGNTAERALGLAKTELLVLKP
jgi:universal stress protein E